MRAQIIGPFQDSLMKIRVVILRFTIRHQVSFTYLFDDKKTQSHNSTHLAENIISPTITYSTMFNRKSLKTLIASVLDLTTLRRHSSNRSRR